MRARSHSVSPCMLCNRQPHICETDPRGCSGCSKETFSCSRQSEGRGGGLKEETPLLLLGGSRLNLPEMCPPLPFSGQGWPRAPDVASSLCAPTERGGGWLVVLCAIQKPPPAGASAWGQRGAQLHAIRRAMQNHTPGKGCCPPPFSRGCGSNLCNLLSHWPTPLPPQGRLVFFQSHSLGFGPNPSWWWGGSDVGDPPPRRWGPPRLTPGSRGTSCEGHPRIR